MAATILLDLSDDFLSSAAWKIDTIILRLWKVQGMNLAKYIQPDENRRLNAIDISIKILFTI